MKKAQISIAIILSISLISCKKIVSNYDIPIDGDGNVYTTITIGTQTWMVENLHTTHFNDGTKILEDTTWNHASDMPTYCYYDNNPANESTYGILYNWYAVNTGKLAPEGWHVATQEDWNLLADYLGGLALAGGKLKALQIWEEPNTGASNASGLGLLPTGCCLGSFEYGKFENIGYIGYWWTSTSSLGGGGWTRQLSYDSEALAGFGAGPDFGFAVLCVKNQ